MSKAKNIIKVIIMILTFVVLSYCSFTAKAIGI